MDQYQKICDFYHAPMVAEPLTFLSGKEKRKERRAKERKQNKR